MFAPFTPAIDRVAGTFGGFALSVIPNLTSADVLKTIVLAFIAAVVSFGVTLLLKQLTSKKNKLSFDW